MDRDLQQTENDSFNNFPKFESIFKRAIDHLNCALKHEEGGKQMLEDELKVISRDIEDDEKIIVALEDYSKKIDILKLRESHEDDFAGELGEIYSKMDVLHWRLCNLTRQVAKVYYVRPDESSNENKAPEVISEESCETKQSDEGTDSSLQISQSDEGADSPLQIPTPPLKKSFLGVLKCLIYNLNPKESDKGYGRMKIDDSVLSRDINFLLEKEIVVHSKDDPSYIELLDLVPDCPHECH